MRKLNLLFVCIVFSLSWTTLASQADGSISLLRYYDTDIVPYDVVLFNDGTKAYLAGWGGNAGIDTFQVIDCRPTRPSWTLCAIF
jgi:hypothetical protein